MKLIGTCLYCKQIILPLMQQNSVATWKISLWHSYVCNQGNVICFEFLANSSLAHTVVGNRVLPRCGERTLHLHQYQLSEVSLGIVVAWRKKINTSIKSPLFFQLKVPILSTNFTVSKPPGWVFVMVVALCICFLYNNMLKWMQSQMLLC